MGGLAERPTLCCCNAVADLLRSHRAGRIYAPAELAQPPPFWYCPARLGDTCETTTGFAALVSFLPLNPGESRTLSSMSACFLQKPLRAFRPRLSQCGQLRQTAISYAALSAVRNRPETREAEHDLGSSG